jgi:hypothetical protein
LFDNRPSYPDWIDLPREISQASKVKIGIRLAEHVLDRLAVREDGCHRFSNN